MPVRWPYLVDLHADPFERTLLRGNSYEYEKWNVERILVTVPAQGILAKFLKTIEEFPPRQKPGSFSIGDALSKMQDNSPGKLAINSSR